MPFLTLATGFCNHSTKFPGFAVVDGRLPQQVAAQSARGLVRAPLTPKMQVTPELYPSRGTARHPLRFIIPGLKSAEQLLATLDVLIHLLGPLINKDAAAFVE